MSKVSERHKEGIVPSPIMHVLWTNRTHVMQLTTALVFLGCVECQTTFIITPRNPLQVESGSNVTLRWDYYSENTLNFTLWGKVDDEDKLKTVISIKQAGGRPVIEKLYKDRVKIQGQATLLLIGVQSSDDGRYICKLVFEGEHPPVFNVTTLEIKASKGEELLNDDDDSNFHPEYIAFLAVLVILICFVILYVFLGYRKRGYQGRKEIKSSNQVNRGSVYSPDEIAMGQLNAKEMYGTEEPDGRYSDVDNELDDRGYCIVPPLLVNPTVTDWEFPRENLIIMKVIGNGAFAQVAKGNAQGMGRNQESRLVAVKMLKKKASKENEEELLAELAMMKGLEPHPNVIQLLGCITKSDPIAVIVEYVPHGDLLGYLRKSRGLQDSYFNDPDTIPKSSLSPHQLVNFALDIASGMDHLSSHKIIHRDLAARNVLVGEGEICKITDFGMAKDIKKDNVFKRTTAGRVPVKWTAIESLLYGTCTTMSDVWSYGVVLYEIFTIGGSPYPKAEAKAVFTLLERGRKMSKPDHISDSLYQIMLGCWQNHPEDRPSFSELRRKIKLMGANGKEFLNLVNYDSTLYQSLDELDA